MKQSFNFSRGMALPLALLFSLSLRTPGLAFQANEATRAALKNPKDGQLYVWIPPGRFMMGCSPGDDDCKDYESPQHEETIAKGFRLGRTEVNQAAYERVTGSKAYFHFKGADLPVDQATWTDANQYCVSIGGRLPTEAEWEYAARGGTTGVRYGELDAIAWYDENSADTTHPVGRKEANKYGLYDMLGNVWEWVDNRHPKTEPRVLRGGAWDSKHDFDLRASSADRYEPGHRSDESVGGFRCAWDHP
jgi:formylglycine-generating enzyme required for sulfatase activity